MQFPHSAAIHTATGSHALSLAVARTSWARFHGLMLRGKLATEPNTQGLLITRCPSVHTLFMRYAIDVVYLSKEHLASAANIATTTSSNIDTASARSTYTVTHLHPNLKPWRASIGKSYQASINTSTICLKSAHVLELPAGSIAALGIALGDTVSLTP